MPDPDTHHDTGAQSSQEPSQEFPLDDALTSAGFETWWQHRSEDTQGQTEPQPDSPTHGKAVSPSDLLSCHRRTYYAAQDAPQEEPVPHGTFEAGSQFETIVDSFIRAVAPAECFVTNPVSVQFEVEVVGEGTGLSVSGSTDSVVFTARGDPMLLTEVKQTSGLNYVKDDGPHTRHRAQAHAYAKGLQRKANLSSPPPICYAYGDRHTFELYPVFEEFDSPFWKETVVPWIIRNAELQAEDELPPPVADDRRYMCQYCSFSRRCTHPEPGPEPIRVDTLVENLSADSQESPYDASTEVIGDTDFWWDSDIDPRVIRQAPPSPAQGFLPCHRYSESAVLSHLIAHPSVSLTPTVATQYPFLATHTDRSPPDRLYAAYGAAPQRPVLDWECPNCGHHYSYQDVTWDGDLTNRPNCGNCRQLPQLRGPYPQSATSDHNATRTSQ